MEVSLNFTDDTGAAFTFSGNTVLVFIDETGHELLKDKNYPVFGFGGCLCLAKDYLKQIYEPWKAVESVFEPSQLPLHATDLSKKEMTDVHYDAINNFFANNAFARFATIVSNQTINSSSYDFFAIAIADLHEKIRTLMQCMVFDKVVMFIESSERTKRRITGQFDQYKLEANGIQIPLEHFFVHKKHNEAGIIVADFVAQTAGSTVASKGRKKIQSHMARKDFKYVFGSVDEKLISFIEIDLITSP